MTANMVLLEKITVGAAGASSVTFSSIPQTGYTDLVVKVSVRGTRAYQFDSAQIRFNGDTGSNYSYRDLLGEGGGTPASGSNTSRGISDRLYLVNVMPAANATSNTFGSFDIYIPNYTSSNYKSVSVDAVGENNSGTAGDVADLLEAGLWSSTAAITSITVGAYSASMTANSTFYLYGVAKLGTTPAIVPYATGGDTIMTDGTYWYHTFISSGTFTPQKAISCDYLVVAGGGGGSVSYGGGGGAGGLRSTVTATGGGGSLESALALASGTGYTVTIGAGGGNDASGSNSVFSTITSTGGGRGGSFNNSHAGADGGSGGGSGSNGSVGVWLNGGAGTANQGYAGGSSINTIAAGAGGGGASAVGASTSTAGVGGNGGNGVATSISGSSVTYAGGGGGGSTIGGGDGTTAGTGGTGGGGAGSKTAGGAGTAGTANTGGGGGGGAYNGNGGAGGSGIVIVRYAV
jgi:hypothetical protein